MCQSDVTMKNLSIYFVNIIIIVLFINLCNGQLPDKLICASPKCDVVISRAITTVLYSARDNNLLSFRPNIQVKVLSKSKDLWGVDIQGRRGFVPEKLIREYKIIVPKDDLIEVTAESLVANTLLPRDPEQVTPSQNGNNNRLNTLKPNLEENIQEAKVSNINTEANLDSEKPSNDTKEEELLNSSEEIYVDDDDDDDEEEEDDIEEDDDEDENEVLEEQSKITENLDPNINTTTDEKENIIPSLIVNETESNKASKDSDSIDPLILKTDEKQTENILSNIEETVKSNNYVVESEESIKIKQTEDGSQIPPIYTENFNKIVEDDNKKEYISDNINQIKEGPLLPPIFTDNVNNKAEDIKMEYIHENTKQPQNEPQLPSLYNANNNNKNEIEQDKNIFEDISKLVKPQKASASASEDQVKVKNEIETKTEETIEIIDRSSNNDSLLLKSSEEKEVIKTEEKVPENIKINLNENIVEAPKEIQAEKIIDKKPIDEISSLPPNDLENINNTVLNDISVTDSKIEVIPNDIPTIDATIKINTNTVTIGEQKDVVDEKPIDSKITGGDAPIVIPNKIETLHNTHTHEHEEVHEKNENNHQPSLIETKQETQGFIAPSQIDISKADNETIITEDDSLMPEIINNDKLTTTTPDVANEIPQPPIDDYVTTPSPYIPNPVEVPLYNEVIDNVEKPTNPLNNVINDVKVEIPAVVENGVEKKHDNVGVGSIEEVGNQQMWDTKQKTENVEELNINNSEVNEVKETIEDDSGSFFSNLFNKFFGNKDSIEIIDEDPDHFTRTLQEVLYANPNKNNDKINTEDLHKKAQIADSGFCENVSPNSCPKTNDNNQMSSLKHPMVQHLHHANINVDEKQISYNIDTYIEHLLAAVLDMTDLLMYLVISAFTILLFILGHYYLEKSRKEAPLLAKINELERTVMVSSKDCAIKENELVDIKCKLSSIENNSFGSNEMVIDLKRKLEDSEFTNSELQEQIVGLEKELENAAEAGLELNKMVSELLSSQSGSDSIISSVEELQKQLNEQQETIFSINTTLAEKSRENSELQVLLSEQCGKFGKEFQELERNYEELKINKKDLEEELFNTKEALEAQLKTISQEKSNDYSRLTKDLSTLQLRCETLNKALRKSESKVQSLEDCLKDLKGSNRGEFKELMDVANLRADLLAVSEEKETFKDGLETEIDARKLLEDHVKTVTEEMSKLKQEFNQAEKDKLEAETRLEVLSTYFNNKETQLQKELSIKEAMWMQQQGETTSTVERIRSLQEELQVLKSQNDALRAENEAQSQAHKAQIGILESRAHESWLTARQAERRFDEARSESSTLRRKLTSMAENPLSGDNNVANRSQNPVHDGILNDINVPSPLRIDSPNSPLMGVLPPPPFMPPPFMPPPHPFAPPPFMPGPGEMRPPPLGRVMSPPPLNRYSPNIVDNRDRYTPERGGGRYSPDSRYEYPMSPYETETDFSPPPSPEPRKGYRDRGGYKAYSPPPDSRSKRSKGGLSSGSVDSLGPRKGGKG